MKIKKNQKIIKPWGFEVLLEKNNIYVLKKLFMKKVQNSEKCNQDIKDILLKEDTIINEFESNLY